MNVQSLFQVSELDGALPQANTKSRYKYIALLWFRTIITTIGYRKNHCSEKLRKTDTFESPQFDQGEQTGSTINSMIFGGALRSMTTQEYNIIQ